MAPAHEPVLGRGSLPGPVGRRPASGDLGQSERKESSGPSGRLRSLTALLPSVPEIRYLLARVSSGHRSKPASSWPGRSGDDSTKPRPPPLTTAVKLKHNCSTRRAAMLPNTPDRVPLHTSAAVNRRIQQDISGRVRWHTRHPERIDQRLRELDAEWDIERTLDAN